MRFGMFIHWGPVAIKGTEIGWSRARQVPKEEYDRLYLQFNPVNFNADRWVSVAKAAGMGYLVITSKHHDGFCIWDSEHTDYDITATPFKRDVLKELSGACRKQGIVFCTYHSICDWYHPDYPTDSPGGRQMKSTHNMGRYVKYLHAQTREIIQKYGPLGIMWFDGEWEKPWTHEHGLALYRHIRSLQSDILINNRVDKGRRGMQGATISAEFVGDYETPEQQIGSFNRDRPWGNLHDDLPAVGLETRRQDEVARGVHPDAAPCGRRRRQPAVQRGPDARRSDRAPAGRAAGRDGSVAEATRRRCLRHPRRAVQTGHVGRVDLQGQQDPPVRHELAAQRAAAAPTDRREDYCLQHEGQRQGKFRADRRWRHRVARRSPSKRDWHSDPVDGRGRRLHDRAG